MKLFWGSTSPYVRKVVVAAAECGLTNRIEQVEVFPWDADTKYGEVNPVGKVPALVTDRGQTLYDSPVIIEYLDTLHEGRKLIPPTGEARFERLRIAALGDGMMDAVILLYSELERRPKELQWDFWDNRMRNTVNRSLDALEGDARTFDPDQPDIGQITAAVGIGWLEFRKAILEIDWRTGRPALSSWFDRFSQRPSMTGSMPKVHVR